MSTFLNNFLHDTELRWQEVELLIEQADSQAEQPLYEPLCRAASILMISHIEGFIKDLAKNIVDDLNRNLSFKDIPEHVKLSSLGKYYSGDMQDEKSYRSFCLKLMYDLEQAEGFKLPLEGFLFSDNGNRNPKPDILKSVLSKFGLKDVFKNLHDSSYEQIFESDSAAVRRLSLIKLITLKATSTFPYKANITESSKLKPTKYSGQTTWQEFINNINHIRHQIVHGNTFDNTVSPSELRSSVAKIRVFQYLITFLVCENICKNNDDD